jgi:hypothetical protein
MIENSFFEINDPIDIDIELLSIKLKKYSFAVIRGLIEPKIIIDAKNKLIRKYNPANVSPATGETPKELMSNFQKLSIGGAEHSGVYRPRCMRTFYNPIWEEDIYGLRSSFIKASKLRNLIYGFDLNYAIGNVEDGFWTASRIHNYPAGGGFLVSHIDDIVPVVQKSEGIERYYQPVIIMSKKGTSDDCDFSTGGGFFEVDNKRIFYEEYCELGDIVIYSGATVHGVEDIDLHKTFDTTKTDGRFAGFVTLYKEFSKKNEISNYLNKKIEKISE